MTIAPDWDLSTYFPSLLGPEYEQFIATLDADLITIKATFDTLPAIAAEASAWADALVKFEDIAVRIGHVGGYLGCAGSADCQDSKIQMAEAAQAARSAQFDGVWVIVDAALAAADEPAIDTLLKDPQLAGAEYFLRHQRDGAKARMSPELEGLVTELNTHGPSTWWRLYTNLTGKLKFDLTVDGQVRRVPFGQRRTLMADADPVLRKAAFEGSNQAIKGYADVMAAALNALSGTRLTLDAHRGTPSFLSPALHSAAIEQSTLDTMMAVVGEQAEVARKYLRLKAKLLGRDRLRFCDLGAPLPFGDSGRIPWKDGCDQVLTAFKAAYPDLETFAAHAFEKKWIDYSPRDGKRPGGFCSSSHLNGESRIFLTYAGSFGDLKTLAHELGHAFHAWLMRDMRGWAREYPMTLAETASIFAEQILIEHLLNDPNTDPAVQAAMLDGRMQQASAFLLNIPMRLQFERALYTERAHGELTVDRLCALMVDAQDTWYGDAISEHDPWFWATKLHFYIDDIRFYNFPYTFGFLFSLGIYEQAKKEGPSFLPSYAKLLRKTGMASAEDVAKDALGVDLGQPDFWRASVELLKRDLARFEALTSTL